MARFILTPEDPTPPLVVTLYEMGDTVKIEVNGTTVARLAESGALDLDQLHANDEDRKKLEAAGVQFDAKGFIKITRT